jgi:hypothetical protein
MPRSVLIGAGGQTVSEPLRHLELPSLPQVGSEGAALQFGDWLTMGQSAYVRLGSVREELVGTVADGGGRLLWEVARIYALGTPSSQASRGD